MKTRIKEIFIAPIRNISSRIRSTTNFNTHRTHMKVSSVLSSIEWFWKFL